MKNSTTEQYDAVVQQCREIFSKKLDDYGASWRVLRPSSITDQLFIKAQRIRTLEEKGGIKKIEEGIDVEFRGIVNYSVIALIQIELEAAMANTTAAKKEIEDFYNKKIEIAKNLMLAKNHDYGEAWRDMRTSSFTDLILMKLLRVKQIEDNGGKTIISEGMESHFYDMINYAIFALIKLEEFNENITDN